MPGFEYFCLQGLQLATRRDDDGAFDALIVLEPQLKGARRIGLVVGQRDDGRFSSRHHSGLQGQLSCKLVAGIASANDKKAEMIGIIALPLGGQALDGNGSLLACVAEEPLQERELLLDLRVLVL